MIVLALDPGSEKTAYVFYDTEKKEVGGVGHLINDYVLNMMCSCDRMKLCDALVCEFIQSQGMVVGKTVFETCYWIGRFWQAYGDMKRIYRSDEKMHLCGSMRAKDSNIRQALIDKFPATGDGKCPQVGTKKKPGPLYGISGDMWSALAVAVTYAETKL